ncbi:MAG: hypothetical protein HY678_10075 [Chloroflexi bacterium]|nr:hypothetical protein [Chloroflexota bacterium]
MPAFEELLRRYLELFPDEKAEAAPVLRFLKETPVDADRVAWNNFNAHLTASCLLVDPIKRQILLFLHPRHGMLLQPGGHYDLPDSPDQSPIDVATQKLHQETPFNAHQVRYLPYDFDDLVPIDIDTHPIPEDPWFKHPPHYHHDFRYVFLAIAAEGSFEVPAAYPHGGPAYAYRWYDFGELNRIKTFSRLSRKLHRFLSRVDARRRFCVNLREHFRPRREINTIVVAHLLPDAFEFIDTLGRSTMLRAVFPKPKSRHKETEALLVKSGVAVLDVSRDNVARELPKLLDGERQTVLLDIGGWFVPALETMSAETASRIAGIVEDTRNGLDKYEELARSKALPVPVVSVAESELKASEDYEVGKSIVFSAEAILRECGLLIEHLECGVIGYGKIGRSIAYHLQQRGLRPHVVEIDPLRQVEAMRNMCSVQRRAWVNRNVDVLFCATGKRATGIGDFRSLKPGAFVFSVTSPDDEFDASQLPSEYTKSPVAGTKHAYRYEGPHNHFHLVHEGGAVNFIHQAVLGEFIQLVKGGIFAAIRVLADDFNSLRRIYSDAEAAAKGPGFAQLFELEKEDQRRVARLWIETVLLGVKLEE